MLGRTIRFPLLIMIGLFLFLFVSDTQADLHQQRQYFLDAEKAFKEGNRYKFKTLMSKLTGYPLYPYLVFMGIKKNMSLEKEKEILSFIDKYKSSPLSLQLRKMWLKHLADQHQWHRLVRDYQDPVSQSVQ